MERVAFLRELESSLLGETGMDPVYKRHSLQNLSPDSLGLLLTAALLRAQATDALGPLHRVPKPPVTHQPPSSLRGLTLLFLLPGITPHLPLLKNNNNKASWTASPPAHAPPSRKPSFILLPPPRPVPVP